MEESVKPTEVAPVTNPNGANQHKLDPRQDVFLAGYLDPTSETWGNAYQSAVRAGYEESYALNIMNLMPTWLSDKLEDTGLLQQAMVNLKEFLATDDEKLQAIRADMTKFTFKGLQKAKWSERAELTGKDGKDLVPEKLTDEEKDALLSLLNK